MKENKIIKLDGESIVSEEYESVGLATAKLKTECKRCIREEAVEGKEYCKYCQAYLDLTVNRGDKQ